MSYTIELAIVIGGLSCLAASIIIYRGLKARKPDSNVITKPRKDAIVSSSPARP